MVRKGRRCAPAAMWMCRPVEGVHSVTKVVVRRAQTFGTVLRKEGVKGRAGEMTSMGS